MDGKIRSNEGKNATVSGMGSAVDFAVQKRKTCSCRTLCAYATHGLPAKKFNSNAAFQPNQRERAPSACGAIANHAYNHGVSHSGFSTGESSS